MALISSALNLGHELKAYHTTDPALSDSLVLILYGPAPATAGSSIASSRIQTHVFTPAGFQSFPKLTIVPGSLLYRAVECLPRERQGDEICRALAYSLLKYFSELPEAAKETWSSSCLSSSRTSFKIFTEEHAADVARRMNPVESAPEVIQLIEKGLAGQTLSYLDVDVILPAGAIQEPRPSDDQGEDLAQYGTYAPLIKLFGEPAFIPTSRIRRAPSKPTALSRSSTFTKSRKEAIRRDLCELVDTEESYVSKLYDLVHSVAADFREKAAKKSPYSTSPSAQALDGLFPACLDQMLQKNSAFLEVIRNLLEETENAAIKDIESHDGIAGSWSCKSSLGVDHTGATRFAECFLEHFPTFSNCYGEYLRAHGSFGQSLKVFMTETGSSFSKRVQETGEQRLMSMLIEPVQRLPRYSLYIDGLVKNLPLGHSAVRPLMKAKDIVGDICAQDASLDQTGKITERLRGSISAWPSTLQVQTRLITALDATQVSSAYQQPHSPDSWKRFILLLFADQLVLLTKPTSSTTTARTVLAEMDNVSTSTTSSPEIRRQLGELEFHASFRLNELNFAEMDNGNLMRLLQLNVTGGLSNESVHILRLEGPYEGKVARFTKDIAKARVESRFSEAQRESNKWEARDAESKGLSLFSAIFETEFSERTSSSFVVVIDPARGTVNTTPGEDGVDVVASISSKGDGFYRVDIEAVGEKGTHDHVTIAEFLPVLCKRFANILHMRNHIRNPAVAGSLFQHNQRILKSLPLSNFKRETVQPRPRAQSASPVKKLASLFGGSGREQNTMKPLPSTPFISNPELKKSPSKRGPDTPAMTETLIRPTDQDTTVESLEQTLECYLLALQARKGNVVGRVVAARHFADEVTVNEVYNRLLENPLDHEKAAQSSVDVVFAAFEKFIKVAWQEKFGPIVPLDVLEELQTKSQTLSPLDYEDFISSMLSQLAPQNRRALRAVVALLAELLDGTGNDGDRGVLTAAMAEIIFDGDAHASIPIFDRLVEEEEIMAKSESRSGSTTPYPPSLTSTRGTTNHGSISSKASSLGKRFGLGSFKRQHSNKESKSNASILRSWSKRGTSPTSLGRTKSVDLLGRPLTLSRPNSQDRPKSPLGGERPATGRSLEQTEDASLPLTAPVTPKKKRRSSLSDLKALPVPNTSPFWAVPSLQRPDGKSPRARTPEPASPILSKGLTAQSPVRPVPAVHDSLKDSPKKENIQPLFSRPNETVFDDSTNVPDRTTPADAVPKDILTERPGAGNTPPRPSQPGSPKKLRVQSPQKIRERLSTQQKAIASADSALEDELERIGEELSALKSRSGNTPATSFANSPTKREQAELLNLSTKIKAFETKWPHLIKNLTTHVETLERDLTSSSQVAEKKARQLDQQLKQANAENQMLYQQLNDKLNDVFTKVSGGNGTEELRNSLRESQDEAARLRTENVRLKREVAGLRAQLNEP